MRRRLLLSIALIGALFLLLLVIVHSAPVRGFVRGRVEAWLRQHAGIEAKIGDLDYSLTGLTVDIRDLVLAPATRPDAPFLVAAHVRAAVDGLPPLRPLRLRMVDASRARITLARDREGTLNLPTAGGGGTAPATAWTVPDAVAIRHLAFTYSDARTGFAAEVPDLTWLARKGAGGLEGAVGVDGYVTARWPDRSVSATGLRGRLRWNGREAAIDDVQAALHPAPAPATGSGGSPRLGAGQAPPAIATIQGSARLDDVFGTPTTAVDAHGTLALAPAATWARAPADAAGTIRWTARAVGPLSALTADIRAEGDGVTVRRAPPMAVSSQAHVEDGWLDLREARLRLAGGGEVRATARVPLADQDEDAVVSGSWRRVPLGALLAASGVGPAGDVEARLEGQTTMRWGPAGLASLVASLDNQVAPTPDGTGLDMSGRAALRVSDGRWTMTHAHTVGAVQLSGTAQGTIRSPDLASVTVGGPIAVRVLDAAQAARDLAALGAIDPGLAGRVAGGDIAFDGRLDGTLLRPVARGTITGRQIEPTEGLPLDVSARLSVDRTHLAIEQGEVAQGPNVLTAVGSIDFLRRAVRGHFEAVALEFAVPWQVAALPAEWEPRGRIVAEGTVTGSLARPRADVRLSGTLGVRDVTLMPVAANVRVDGPRLTVEGIRLDSAGGQATGDVEVDLDAPGRPFSARVVVALDAGEHLAGLWATGLGTEKLDASFLQGAWGGRATIEGQLANLTGASVDALIERIDGTIAGLRVRLDEPALVERRSGSLGVSRLTLHTGTSVLTLDGAIGEGQPGLAVTTDARLEDFAPLLAWLAPGGAPALSGTVRLSARASGSANRPRLDGTIDASGLVVAVGEIPGVTDVAIGVTLRDGVIDVARLSGTWQQASLDATASVPLRLLDPWVPATWRGLLESPAAPARLDARVRGVTPAALAPFVSPETLASLGGRMSARLSLEADRLAPEAARGEIVLSEARVALAQIPLEQHEPTRLVIGDGRLRVATWQWNGPGTTLSAAGGLSWNAGAPRFDIGLDAGIDLRMASAFVRPGATAGRADVSVSLAGPLRSPIVEGQVRVSGGEYRLRDPRLAISDLEGTLVLVGDEFKIEGVRGSINGGTLTAGGTARLEGWTLAGFDLTTSVRDAAVEFPTGLRTEAAADLRLVAQPSDPAPLLSGTVTVLQGSYREEFWLASTIFSGRRPAGAALVTAPARRGPLDSVRLDIGLKTREDISAESNYGRVEAGAALRIQGTIGSPTLGGRVALREGGAIFLGGNTYRLESGSIDFRGGASFVPVLDISAGTQVSTPEGPYTIRLHVSGTPEDLRAELSSQPPLGQSDIVSLLVTGRTVADGGLSTHVVGQQVLGYLSGDLLNFAGRAVGLDSVRIDRGLAFDDLRFDPTVIAGDEDPSSRLTITKSLARQVEVVLSQNLGGSGELTWLATWRVRPTIAFRVLSLDNTDRTYEFRQELTFGGSAREGPAGRRAAPRVSDVAFTGAGTAEAALRNVLALKPGKRFDFYKWQSDRDRVLAHLHDAGRFEARVSSRRTETSDEDGRSAVGLTYEVTQGPKGQLVVEGTPLSAGVLASIREEWTHAVLDDFLAEDVTRLVRTALARDGYLRADVTTTIESGTAEAGEVKTLRVVVSPGPLLNDRAFAWTGNDSLDGKRLDRAVIDAGLASSAWLNPDALEEALRELYVAEGFLAASVAAGEVEFNGNRVRLPVRITEGPRARIGAVSYTGARAVPETSLVAAARLTPAEILRPAQLDTARRSLESLYVERGFSSAQVDIEAIPRGDGIVDLAIAIAEGPQQVLAGVEVAGAPHTHPGLITTALKLETGQPLDPDALYEARRRLYETGAFRQVDVDTVTAGDTQQDPSTGIAREPVTARVTLEEWPLWRFRYGLMVTDLIDPSTGDRDIGPGVSGDIERSNLFGRASTLGLAARYEDRRQAVRAYFSSPRFFRWPVSSTLFAQQEWQQYGDTDTEITGATFEQRYRLRQTTQVNYGLFYRRTRLLTEVDFQGQPVPFELVVNYGGLFSAVAFDRRDDPFDAKRGWFHSSSMKYAAKAFASDLRFVRWVTQQSLYYPLGRGIVLAWNGRLGLADGFGQEVVLNERFFAGGGSSVRGYREDSLGPRDFDGVPLGGEALLVLNQEARFPIWKWLRGVAFVDAGNAFAEPTSIDFGDLSVGAGLGFRLSTPIGLLRLDYGVPVGRGRSLSDGRLHFSFGQVF